MRYEWDKRRLRSMNGNHFWNWARSIASLIFRFAHLFLELKHKKGILYKYAKTVASASEGCVTDKF